MDTIPNGSGSTKSTGPASVRKDIIIIGGSKGGVGKSLVSMSLLDYLLHRKEELLLIETDTSNPDVFKAYNGQPGVTCEVCDLDEADGWVDFINICEEHPTKTIVVNTAARNNKGVAAYGKMLESALPELKRRLFTWWVINRQRDSIELLREFMETLPGVSVHVVRNSYFGDELKFELYDSSKIKREVEGRGGKSVTFPDLADRVADDLHSSRIAISVALSATPNGSGDRVLPLGNRAELHRWRGEVAKVLGGLLNARA
jgi:hypothetical protein